MSRLSFFLFATTFFFLSTINILKSQNLDNKYVIIAYLAGTDWTKQDIDVSKFTHINYAFAVPSKEGKLEKFSARDSLNLLHLNSLRTRNKELKVLISIGGWGGSKYFSDVALTDSSRKIFAQASVQFLKNHKLDGLDVDWEYPAQPGDNNIFRSADKENYTLLLKELRKQLDEQSKRDGREGDNKYLLTVATGVDTAFVNNTNLGEASKYLDYVNIMTYDIYHGNDKVTGHHANLHQSKKGDQSRNSSEDGVNGHLKAGVPVSKIVLGIPFYGRGWTNVVEKDNGLYQPSDGKHFAVGYEELKSQYIGKNGYTRYWDEDAKVPYLWNSNLKTFITYIDTEALEAKINFVKTKGLAGVMFWEYSHDMRENVLLNTLYKRLNQKK